MVLLVGCGGAVGQNGSPVQQEDDVTVEAVSEGLPDIGTPHEERPAKRGVFPVITEMIQTPDGEVPFTYELIDGQAVVDGCIAIDLSKIQQRIAAGSMSQSKLAIRSGSDYRWPNATVPYGIGVSVSVSMEQNIRRALQILEHYTPLRFVPHIDQADYVIFLQRERNGVSTAYGLGRQGGRQEVVLDSSAITSEIMHEIGHVIGLFHEQQREDRDNYIDIHWENIEGSTSAWRKYSENRFLLWGGRDGEDFGPYDFDSMMHYDAFAGSANDRPVITRKDGSTTGVGRRLSYPYLTQHDQEGIRAMYCPMIGNDPARCTPYVEPQQHVIFYPEWAISVSPDNIDLGQMRRGYSSRIQQVTITNITQQATGVIGELYRRYSVEVDVRIESTDRDALTITDQNGSAVYDYNYEILGPGESRTVFFYFVPRAGGGNNAALRIHVSGLLGIVGRTDGEGLELTFAEGSMFAGVRAYVEAPLLETITPNINFIEQVVELPRQSLGVAQLQPGQTRVDSEVAATFGSGRGRGSTGGNRACTPADYRLMQSNPSRKIFSVQNTGHGSLAVEGVSIFRFDGAVHDSSFQIVCFREMPFQLPSGDFADGIVEYFPRSRLESHYAQLRIWGSHGQETRIELNGRRVTEIPAAGRLEVDRRAIDFGEVPQGQFRSELIVLRNSGGTPLRILNIYLYSRATADGSGFQLQPMAYNTMLYPGQVRNVTIWFQPRRTGRHRETLRIVSYEPDVGGLEYIDVNMSGQGTP